MGRWEEDDRCPEIKISSFVNNGLKQTLHGQELFDGTFDASVV